MAAVGEEAGAEDETLLAEQRVLEPHNAGTLTLSLLQACRDIFWCPSTGLGAFGSWLARM